jgi:hypothetical protein
VTTEALGVYLNDHLSGSVAAVEMIERTIGENPGTPLARALEEILLEIRGEQQVLREVLARLETAESPLKKAGAWLMEKAGRLKLGGTGEGELSRLEALEALGIGIQGKLALWRGLQRVANRHPALAGVDLPGLERQGRAQWERVEAHRVEAALQAL